MKFRFVAAVAAIALSSAGCQSLEPQALLLKSANGDFLARRNGCSIGNWEIVSSGVEIPATFSHFLVLSKRNETMQTIMVGCPAVAAGSRARCLADSTPMTFILAGGVGCPNIGEVRQMR